MKVLWWIIFGSPRWVREFEMTSGLKGHFLWEGGCFKWVLGDGLTFVEFVGPSSNILVYRWKRILRRCQLWMSMLNVIRGRLQAWGHRCISFVGRIVLINAVLSFILIFYLSFLKMSIKVKIQCQFLWTGVSRQHKICWVKWEEICKPNKEWGLV
jgi:hypothetical protein